MHPTVSQPSYLLLLLAASPAALSKLFVPGSLASLDCLDRLPLVALLCRPRLSKLYGPIASLIWSISPCRLISVVMAQGRTGCRRSDYLQELLPSWELRLAAPAFRAARHKEVADSTFW
jgi:hypothetical protein